MYKLAHNVDWNNLWLVIELQKPVKPATIVGSAEPTINKYGTKLTLVPKNIRKGDKKENDYYERNAY